MGFRLHPLLLVALVAAICAGLIAGLIFLRVRQTATPQTMLAHLPAQDGVVLAIDFQSLRQSGMLAALAGASVAQDPEYKTFVLETAFDYQRDLDFAVAWFGKDTTCLLLRGRFNWQNLTAYVTSQGGICRNSFCRVDGSTPERRISFFPLSRNVMALAVGPDSWAAANLTKARSERQAIRLPAQPVWLLIPASTLRSAENLPAGMRLFAKAMEGADRVMLSLGVAGDRLEVLLDVTCRSAEEASRLSSQLEGLTSRLKEIMAQENKTPDPRDLTGVLAAGSFRREDRRLLGRWPVQRVFLESILGSPQ